MPQAQGPGRDGRLRRGAEQLGAVLQRVRTESRPDQRVGVSEMRDDTPTLGAAKSVSVRTVSGC